MKCPLCHRPMKILISYPTNLYYCRYNNCSLVTPIPLSSCANKKEARRLTNKLDRPTLRRSATSTNLNVVRKTAKTITEDF